MGLPELRRIVRAIAATTGESAISAQLATAKSIHRLLRDTTHSEVSPILMKESTGLSMWCLLLRGTRRYLATVLLDELSDGRCNSIHISVGHIWINRKRDTTLKRIFRIWEITGAISVFFSV